MEELTADDLEERYEDSILEEFGKVVDDFRNVNDFRNDSMIRLMQDKIKQYKLLNQGNKHEKRL